MIKSPANNYSLEKDGVTQSLMQMYMECPRKFAIATHGWSSPSKFAMELGSCGHKAIELNGQLGKYDFDKIISTAEREQILAAISAIIPSYFSHYAKQDKKYRENPEHVFDIKYNGVRLRGKIDSIKISGAKTIIKETKFKSRISEDDLDRGLSLDWQSLFYTFAIFKETGTLPQAVEYDVIRYPTIKPNHLPADIHKSVIAGIKKEPEHWFKRWETRFDEMDIFSFTGEITQKLNEMRDRKIWYRNECSCKGLFKCPYLDYCTTGKTTNLIKKELFSELNK